jgi:hypothetical protein
MALIQLAKDQREFLHRALQARYLTPASMENMLLLRLDRHFQHIVVAGSTYPQDVLAVIQAAEAEGWLLPLVRQLCHDVPADQELKALEAELAPLAPPPGVDHFDVCRLGNRVMVDRKRLRDSLRQLSTTQSERIMVVTGEKSSGKSHSFQLISYLRAFRGGFSLALIDLEAYRQVLDVTREPELTPDYIARTLVKKLQYDLGRLEPPRDSQWARWVLDFCDDLEARAQEDDRWCWVVIDGFGSVPLAEATVDLIKDLAVRINKSLPQFRLILLGYGGGFTHDVLDHVTWESTEPIGIEELLEFFGRAYQQLRIPATNDKVVNTVTRVLSGLDPTREDFLFHLEPRVRDELATATGQGGGP